MWEESWRRAKKTVTSRFSKEKSCVFVDCNQLIHDQYMFKAATINGVLHGHSDLGAPEEVYCFDWSHERVLWLGCVLGECYKSVVKGVITYKCPCKLGILPPEQMRRIIRYVRDRTYPTCAPTLLRSLRSNSSDMRQFLIGVALCHAVSPSGAPDAVNDAAQIVGYHVPQPGSGSSSSEAIPENRTVIQAAAGEQEVFELLAVLPDTKDRERMSVVVRSQDNTLRLYTRGSHEVLTNRLRPGSADSRNLQAFHQHRLRMVSYATRHISEDFFNTWIYAYMQYTVSLTHDRRSQYELEKIETGLRLLGSAGLQRPLRTGVWDCIRSFQDKGTHLCLVSTLSQDTTLNIANQCGLLSTVSRDSNGDAQTSSEGVINDGTMILHGMAGESSPRFLHALQESREAAARRSAFLDTPLVPATSGSSSFRNSRSWQYVASLGTVSAV